MAFFIYKINEQRSEYNFVNPSEIASVLAPRNARISRGDDFVIASLNKTIMEEEIEKNPNRIYEFSVLLVPTIDEAQVPAIFGDLKAQFEAKGAVFIGEDMPKMMELAYEMPRTIENKKTWFSNAYFGWVKFEIDPSELAELKEVFARNEQILRSLTLKTVRENTIASKKSPYNRRRDTKLKEDGTPEEKPEINEAQVDAEIEALVTE